MQTINEIEDGEFNEIENEHLTEDKKDPITKLEIAQTLSAALKDGTLSKSQAARMRAELGISQAQFTRKQPLKSEQKAKRKAQKAARRANRK